MNGHNHFHRLVFTIISIFFLILMLPYPIGLALSQTTHNPGWLERQRLYSKKTAAVKRITPQMAYALFKAGKALLIGVDDREYFQRRHIVGSINIPPNKLKRVRLKVPRDKLILLYCR